MRCVALTTTRPAHELAAAHRVVASLREVRAEDLRRLALGMGETGR